MGDRSFDLDAILAEAAALKQRRQEKEPDAAYFAVSPEASVSAPATPPQTESLKAAEPTKEPPAPSVVLPEEPPEEEEPVRLYEEKPAAPVPSVEEVSEEETSPPIPADDHTRVVELPDRHRKKKAPKPEPAGIEGQMEWSNLGLEEPAQPEEPPVDEEEIRRQLQESRAEKVRGFRLSGVEEETEPEEIAEPESPALEDYGSYEETESVRSDLEYRRSTAMISFLMSLLLEGVLVVLTAVTQLTGQPPFEPVIFLLANAALLILMMVVNHRLVGSGLANLFRGCADTASAASVACVPVLIHTVAQLSHLTEVHTGDGVLTAAAGLCLIAGAGGRYLRIARIADNFRFVSFEGEKTAVSLLEDPAAAVKIGRTTVAEGVPRVAHARPATFLTGFLTHSYADDALDGQMRHLVPGGLLLTLLPSLLFGFWKQDWWLAFSAFTVTLCLVFPCSALLSGAALLRRGSRRVLRAGALLGGYEAVERFGDIDGVTVEAEELFPAESLLLHGIKTFKGTRIDEAIMDAAAVSIAEGGPLAAVFRRIITDRVDILQPVDSLVYEQDMGVSGWVGGRRVLVGNRRLLQNHGVDVPSNAYEERYAVDGRKLVYLSTAGELSAMFVLSYLADEELADQLQSFARCRIDLLVHSCDPNVTEALVCDTLGLDDYHVEILDAQAARTFVSLETDPVEQPALLATDGRLPGLAATLTGCHRLRRAFTVARILQLCGAILGLALGMALLFAAGMVLPPLLTFLFVLLGTLLGWLLPLLFG